MRAAPWRRSAVALVALLALTACGGGGSSSKSSPSKTKKASQSDNSDVSDVSDFSENNPVVGKSSFGPNDDDKIIKASVKDIETFWSEEYPALYGSPYEKISNGVHPYSPDNPPPTCPLTKRTGSYEDNPGNAYYCIRGDYLAWDTANLTNDLLDQFGPFTLAIVAAHELGHGISARAGVYDQNPPTFLTEQQADCFAGAYTQWVANGSSTLFDLKLSDLDSALGGFLQIRDPTGFDSVNDPAGHGSAFQRVSAFEDGLTGGGDTCKTYADGSFTVVPETFTSEEDYQNQGNLPLDTLLPQVTDNLEKYWTEAMTGVATWTPLTVEPYDPDTDTVTCGKQSATGDDAIGLAFYCEQSDTAYVDATYLLPAANEIGDLAAALVIADLYSERAQLLAGLPTGTLDGSLQGSCLTGTWIGTLVEGQLDPQGLTLSPGDLDEAVASFLKFSDTGDRVDSGDSTYGSAFQRLDAFRLGFLDSFNNGYLSGLSTCVSNAASTASDSRASDAFSS
ncbi:MAG: neutral zinc metallopeptidase [Acidimicrobiales bacterium]